VSSDEKVGQNAGSLATLKPVCAPSAACQKVGFARQWLYSDFIAIEKIVTFAPGYKMNAEFRVDYVRNDQGTGLRGSLKGVSGTIIEIVIGQQNVEENAHWCELCHLWG